MAIYYTFDTAVEEFLHWCAKCEHYGIDPKNVIAVAMEENAWLSEEPEDTDKKE